MGVAPTTLPSRRALLQRARTAILLLGVSGVLLATGVGRASPPDTESAHPSRPPTPTPPVAIALTDGDAKPLARDAAFAMTLSGGASLGAYEAGVQYFLTEAMKGYKHPLRLATGASAGSANALTAVMNSCRGPQPNPMQALGWQLWMPVGLQNLFTPAEVTEDAIFHRNALLRSMDALKAVWANGLDKDCEALLGVSVTYREPEHLEVRREGRAVLRVQRQVENFRFRIRGRGPGKPPLLENYTLQHARLPQAVLPLETGPEGAAQLRNFDQLVQLLFASSAFPLAFRPQPLNYCITSPNDSPQLEVPTCEEPQASLFVDGGMFDNTPLRLAFRMARSWASRRARGGSPAEPTGKTPGGTAAPPGVGRTRFIYVDPAMQAFPPLDPSPSPDQSRGALDTLGTLTANFVSTSRSRELYALVEEGVVEDLAERVALTSNYLPVISSHLGGFFGFFERDFRVFDFYVGMYDALVDARHYLARRKETDRNAQLQRIFPVLATDDPQQVPTGYRPLACMLSQLQPETYPGYAPICQEPELANFSRLLQVAFDRLHAVCLRNPATVEAHPADPLQHMPACRAAVDGGPAPQVPGLVQLPPSARQRSTAEDDLGYTLRLLAGYGFVFHDLGLPGHEAGEAPARIRESVMEIVDALADAQPSTVQAAAVGEAGRLLADEVSQSRPEHWAYLTVGTAIEFGASAFSFAPWGRLNGALQIREWDSLTVPKRLTIGFTPAIGPEITLPSLSGPALMTALGLRIGYQLGAADTFLTERCSAAHVTGGDARDCSQWVLQQYTALTVFDRLRLQLNVEYFPEKRPLDYDSRIDLQLSFGMQFF